MPEMKDLVPSIGSSTQTYSASARSLPNSSPMMPWSGKVRRISVRMAVSAARSAAVTGSKLPARPLSSTPSAVRKNGRMVSPETGRQLVDEGREIDRRHAALRRSLIGLSCRLSKTGAAAATAAGLSGSRAPCDVEPPASARSVEGRDDDERSEARPQRGAAAVGAAVALVATLGALYIVSQFLRNSIGVIAPNLAAELGLSPVEIGLLSSVFFFVFAAVANAARHGARPLRPEALHAGRRGDHGARRASCSPLAHDAGVLIARPRPARASAPRAR